MIPKPSQRIVLDTNVCLDLFMFRDPRWQALLDAMQSGAVECVTRADCRMEWTLVLAYTKLGLDEAAQRALLAEFDRWITLVDANATNITLPVCKDPDDQKFLELAAASGAAVLLSKDKALLKLARRCRKQGLFEILSPPQWVDTHARSAAEACEPPVPQ
jgi:putative PIN family toxin of toxin-antitoxin system